MTKVCQSVKNKIMKNKGKMRASHWSEDSEGEVEIVESQCKFTHNFVSRPLLT